MNYLMNKNICTIIYFASAFLFISSVDGSLADTSPKKDFQIVASEIYQTNSDLIQVNIERYFPKKPGSLNSQDLMEAIENIRRNPKKIKYLLSNTFSNEYSNIPFFITKSNISNKNAGEKTSVLGVVYGFDNNIPPRIGWSADVSWGANGELYCIFARSRAIDLTIAVLQPDPNNTLGSFHEIFDLLENKKKKWPKPLDILSEIHTIVQSPDICSINRIEVLPEPNYLLISMHKEHADCDPIYVRFDLDTKEWFWLTMEAKPIEPFN